MTARCAAVVVACACLGACGSTTLDRPEAEATARDALLAADLSVSSVRASSESDGRWTVIAATTTGTLQLTLADTGRVTAIDQPDGVDLEQGQLEAIAAHRSATAERNTLRRRGLLAVAALAAALGGAFAWAHRLRLAEEAGADAPSGPAAGDDVDA